MTWKVGGEGLGKKEPVFDGPKPRNGPGLEECGMRGVGGVFKPQAGPRMCMCVTNNEVLHVCFTSANLIRKKLKTFLSTSFLF